MRIVDVLPLRDLAPDRCRAIAAALEVGSEHPLARAFDDPAGMVAQALRVLPGRGLEGTIDGRHYRLGSPSFAGGAHRDRLPAAASVVLADDEGPLAGFVLTDPLRADAPATMAELVRRGLAVEIASGDVAPIVESVAREAGIESWRAALSPEDKLEHIRDLQADGAVVAMVGDGINDAPVLAGADVSIAMGEGAPLAQSSADMILLGRTLAPLSLGVDVAHRTLGTIRQNLAWALSYNLIALPLAAAGWVAPWMAAIGMSVSSLIVVLNSTRLGRTVGHRPVRPAARKGKPAEAVSVAGPRT